MCRWLEQMRQPRARALAVRSTEAALAHIATRRFDAVILDRMLDGEDGVEILRELRASALNAGAAVIVASGLVEEPGFGEGLDPDAYMTKPYTDEMLRVRLRVALRRRAALDGD